MCVAVANPTTSDSLERDIGGIERRNGRRRCLCWPFTAHGIFLAALSARQGTCNSDHDEEGKWNLRQITKIMLRICFHINLRRWAAQRLPVITFPPIKLLLALISPSRPYVWCQCAHGKNMLEEGNRLERTLIDHDPQRHLFLFANFLHNSELIVDGVPGH